MNCKEEIHILADEFYQVRPVLTALGDPNRQHLILEMMKMEHCGGARVGLITEKTHLSRPAVSHHLAILKEAGIISVRKEGTKNYYYFDKDHQKLTELIEALMHAQAILCALSEEEKEI